MQYLKHRQVAGNQLTCGEYRPMGVGTDEGAQGRAMMGCSGGCHGDWCARVHQLLGQLVRLLHWLRLDDLCLQQHLPQNWHVTQGPSSLFGTGNSAVKLNSSKLI